MNYKAFKTCVREDYRVFRAVQKGNALLNTLYLPSFKIVFIFRLSQLFHHYKILRPFTYLMVVMNDFLHGVWIGPAVEAGKRLFFRHPIGLAINPNTRIGEYCSIPQQVALGRRGWS